MTQQWVSSTWRTTVVRAIHENRKTAFSKNFSCLQESHCALGEAATPSSLRTSRPFLCNPQNFCFSSLFYVSFFLQKNNTETKSTVWRMNAFSSVITAAIGTYGNSKQAPFWFMFDISFNWIFARKLVSLLRNGPPIMQRGGESNV